MKVSVVMTTYNGQKFLREMLDSLRKQTRKIDELLFFDDGSDDGTVELLTEYIKKYELYSWKVIQNKENLGWEKNFVKGLMSATGEIIFPCDQDDIWHNNKIEEMAAAFERNDDIWLLVSGYHAFSENGGKMVVQQSVKTETNTKISRVVFDEHYYQILRPGCTMALSKEILPVFAELWEPGMPHDALLWCIASLLRKLYLYNDTFIEYRRHNNNASKEISHGVKYKINEIYRTLIVNDWYLKSIYKDETIVKTVEQCSLWCSYREKLLVDKKIIYWIKIYPLKKYYLTFRKYIGDIYYFIKKPE